MSQHPIGCVAVYIMDTTETKILVGTRTATGQPCVPGGKIDWMETAEHAAEREVEEETGLHIEIEDFLGVSDDMIKEPEGHFLTVRFLARVVGGDLKETEPDKIKDFRWVAPSFDVIGPMFADAHTSLSLVHHMLK